MSNDQNVILEVPQAPKIPKKIKGASKGYSGLIIFLVVILVGIVTIYLAVKKEKEKEKLAEENRKEDLENMKTLISQNEKIIDLLTEIKEGKK